MKVYMIENIKDGTFWNPRKQSWTKGSGTIYSSWSTAQSQWNGGSLLSYIRANHMNIDDLRISEFELTRK